MVRAVDSGSDFLPWGIVLAFAVIGLVMAAIWIWSLVDALRVSDQRWAAAGQNKLLWVLLIVFLGVLGSLLYAVIPRPSLRQRAG